MNIFYNNYRQQKELEDSKEEEIDRSFRQQMYPVFVAANLAKFIIHLLSFSAAVILPAYGFELLFNSFYLGLIVGFVMVLVFIELPKWSTINTIFENYVDSKIISYGLSLFAVCLIAPSIASSTFGVPLLVARLSPAAATINLDDIEEKHKKKRLEAVNYFEPQIYKYDKEAKEFFKKYSKYYKSEDRVRLSSVYTADSDSPYNKLLAAHSTAQERLNIRIDSIDSRLSVEMAAAIADNRIIVQEHRFKKDNAGNIAFWLMLVLELCYILIVWGVKYYEDRGKKERRGLNIPTGGEKRTEKRGEKKQKKKTEKKEKQAPTNQEVKQGIQISYAENRQNREGVEGYFDAENQTVLIRLKKGVNKGLLMPKNKKEIEKYIKNASSQNSKRTKFYKSILKNFDND